MLLFDGCTTYTFSVTRYSKARARSLLQHQRGRFIKDRKKKSNNETEADVALARVFVAHLEPRGPVNQ